MPTTANDTQQVAQLARYSISRLRMRVIFVASAFIIVALILARSVEDMVSTLPLFVEICCCTLAVAAAWTTYITGPLARTVMQQQETIAQLQRDLAALRENKS